MPTPGGVLKFSELQVFSSILKLIPRYFTLFHVTINEIVFSISLTVHCYYIESARDFCILILYPKLLMNFTELTDEL